MQPKWRWLYTWNQSGLWTLSSFLMMVMSHKKWFKENYAKQIHPFKKQESNWKTWNANILSEMLTFSPGWTQDDSSGWRTNAGAVDGEDKFVGFGWSGFRTSKERPSFKEENKNTEDIGHTHLHILAQYRGRILIEEKADSHKLLDTLSL